MPVAIGGKAESSFSDPIGLMTDCHRRIERFLNVLSQITLQARGGPLASDQRTALETALRYFREAAPKHTADEEETLFPRLRAMRTPQVEAVLAIVDALEQDHARAETVHAEIDCLGNTWLVNGSISEMETNRLSELIAEVSRLYRDHIGVEEEQVFPLAAAVLSAPEREASGREMAARRGLPVKK